VRPRLLFSGRSRAGAERVPGLDQERSPARPARRAAAISGVFVEVSAGGGGYAVEMLERVIARTGDGHGRKCSGRGRRIRGVRGLSPISSGESGLCPISSGRAAGGVLSLSAARVAGASGRLTAKIFNAAAAPVAVARRTASFPRWSIMGHRRPGPEELSRAGTRGGQRMVNDPPTPGGGIEPGPHLRAILEMDVYRPVTVGNGRRVERRPSIPSCLKTVLLLLSPCATAHGRYRAAGRPGR
jgi:hypothetical protein